MQKGSQQYQHYRNTLTTSPQEQLARSVPYVSHLTAITSSTCPVYDFSGLDVPTRQILTVLSVEHEAKVNRLSSRHPELMLDDRSIVVLQARSTRDVPYYSSLVATSRQKIVSPFVPFEGEYVYWTPSTIICYIQQHSTR